MFSAISNFFSMFSNLFSAGAKLTSAMDLKSSVILIEVEDEVRDILEERGTLEDILATREILIAAGVLQSPGRKPKAKAKA